MAFINFERLVFICIIISNLIYMKLTFYSNSASFYNILKFVTNAQKSCSTVNISFLFLYTESQTIIWNSIFSATLLYNKSCQAFNIFQNWINNIKEISLGTLLKDRIPGQMPLLHDSVVFAFPSHGAPPKSASVTLTLWFSLTPSPQVSEQSPICHSAHWQSTELYLKLKLIVIFK